MTARIRCETGTVRVVDRSFEERLVVGRDSGCDLQFLDPQVSGRHLVIEWDDKLGHYVLEDQASKNGTQLDGIRVAGRRALKSLHVITVARKYDLVFQLQSAPGQAAGDTRPKTAKAATAAPLTTPKPAGAQPDRQAPKQAASETRTPVPEALRPPEPGPRTVLDQGAAYPATVPWQPPVPAEGAQATRVDEALPALPPDPTPGRTVPARKDGWKLTVSGSDRSLLLEEGRYTVGRLRDCQVAIDDESVSRRHAVLEVTSDGLYVEDLGGANGTFVDEQRLTGRQRLAPHASLRFGTVLVQIAPRE